MAAHLVTLTSTNGYFPTVLTPVCICGWRGWSRDAVDPVEKALLRVSAEEHEARYAGVGDV
jgi:hypothetical protein